MKKWRSIYRRICFFVHLIACFFNRANVFCFCRLYPFSPSHHGRVLLLPVISLLLTYTVTLYRGCGLAYISIWLKRFHGSQKEGDLFCKKFSYGFFPTWCTRVLFPCCRVWHRDHFLWRLAHAWTPRSSSSWTLKTEWKKIYDMYRTNRLCSSYFSGMNY